MPRVTLHRIRSSDSDSVHYLSRINDGIRALNEQLSGKKLTDLRESDLTWLERTLGLDKPLASYSARTRQRYLSAAAHGRTAQAERDKERIAKQQRAQSPSASTSKWRVVHEKRDVLQAYGVDMEPYLDDEVLLLVARYYGLDYLVQVLTEQVESTEEYVLRNQREPGHSRWNARGELEDRFLIALPDEYLARGTDPYYYYHGHRPT